MYMKFISAILLTSLSVISIVSTPTKSLSQSSTICQQLMFAKLDEVKKLIQNGGNPNQVCDFGSRKFPLLHLLLPVKHLPLQNN